jgi:predicted nucleic acid-binding protein
VILIDSSVWIDYFNGKNNRSTGLLDGFLDHNIILMADLILTEVLQGFRSEKDFKTAKTLLTELEFVDIVGYECALKSAINFRHLRKKGVTVRKTIDVIIATYCIENGISLLHSDRDFIPFEKLGLKSL